MYMLTLIDRLLATKAGKMVKILLYIFCAGLATIVDYALLYVFTEFGGLYYLWSATLSYCAGMIVNYSLNKVLTFRNKSKQIGKQFSVFAVVSLVGLGLTLLFMALFVEVLGLWYMVAKLFTIILVFIWSYFGHSNLTFKIFK
jgi:putative flippase GtrA